MENALPICVGINGFGLMGRAVFFSSFTDPRMTVTAINDASLSIDYIAYVVQHEAPLPPRERAAVSVVGEYLCIHGLHKIRVSQKHDMTDVAWRDAGVAYVVECTGLSTTRERCWGHVTSGAIGVVIAEQSADAPTVIIGANEKELTKKYPVICAGSPIAVALAPLLRLLHELYGIQDCSYTALHGLRSAEPTAGRSKNSCDWRQTRVGIDNIVPYAQAGTRTLEKVLPFIVDRISGSAFQAPVTKGCAIDVFVRLERPVPKETLDAAVLDAARGHLHDSLAYSEEDLISGDCVPDGRLRYDAGSSQCVQEGAAYKLLLWFDLDKSYAKRVLSLVPLLHAMSSENGDEM